MKRVRSRDCSRPEIPGNLVSDVGADVVDPNPMYAGGVVMVLEGLAQFTAMGWLRRPIPSREGKLLKKL